MLCLISLTHTKRDYKLLRANKVSFFYCSLLNIAFLCNLGNPEPPSELKETGVTSSTISISWRPGTYRRQTQYFVIEYGRTKKKLENIKWKQEKKVDDGQTVMMYTLNNLKSETTYIVVLFAINDIGTSTRTLPLLVHTKGIPIII